MHTRKRKIIENVEGDEEKAESAVMPTDESLKNSKESVKKPDIEVASNCEKWLKNILARELVTTQGKVCAGLTYFVMTVIAIFGCFQVETDFKASFFIREDSYVNEFFEVNGEYFNSNGFIANIYINSTDIDLSSRETQLQLNEFEDAVRRSKQCYQDWFIKNSMQSWYEEYYTWVQQKKCEQLRAGITPIEKTI